METRLLETLIAVADHGSVAAASRVFGISATSVTQRLHLLEADLGTRLAVRIGREIKLTPSGEALLAPARSIIASIKALPSALPDPAGTLRGTVRLGAISTALTGLLPKVIGQWANDHPQVMLEVSPGTSAALYDDLIAGSLDAIIAVHPPFKTPKTIETRIVRREALICLSPSNLIDPRLDDAAMARRLLSRERFIRYDAASWGGRLCDTYLRDQRITVTEFCSLDSLEAIALLVEQGLGVALVPDWSPPWPAIPDCHKLTVDDAAFARRIVLAYPRRSRHGAILDALSVAL